MKLIDDSALARELIAAMDAVLVKHGLYVSNTNGVVRHGDDRTFAVDIDVIPKKEIPRDANGEVIPSSDLGADDYEAERQYEKFCDRFQRGGD